MVDGVAEEKAKEVRSNMCARPLAGSTKKLGAENPQWKGDKVGYMALHEWVRNRYTKPQFCEECLEAPPRDLANISGKYKRELSDWEYLCRRCHMHKDGRISKLIANNRKHWNTRGRNAKGQFA